MGKPHRIQKILANIITLLILFAFLSGMEAHAADTVDQDGASQDGVTFAFDNAALWRDAAVNQNQTSGLSIQDAGNSLLSFYLQNTKNNGPQWLKTTDIQLKLTKDYQPVYAIETIQPFGGIGSNGSLWFWQGSYSNQNVDNTANLGIGWRKLSADQSGMFGLNAFYDYGFQYDLSRLGLGLEYFRNAAELRFNWYSPLSGDRLVNTSYLNNGILYAYIRAVEGFDLEMGTALAGVPWWKVYAAGYYGDNKHHDDEAGYRLRSAVQLSPHISLEIGYTGSKFGGDYYSNVMFQTAAAPCPSLWGNVAGKTAAGDISYKLLQKVHRENGIKTETFNKFVSYTGNIHVSVSDSGGHAIRGVILQAYQQGAAVGSPVLTDSSGNGVFIGLDVGIYTVKATYFSYTAESGPVTVTKDGTSDTAISLTMTGGSAVVTVTDAGGSPLSGVTVMTSGSRAAIGFSLTTVTGSDGKAYFNTLPPGSYTFTAQSGSSTMWSQSIEITAGGSCSFTIILPGSGGNIFTLIKDATGSILSGAAVSVQSDGATIASGTTDGSGAVLFGGIPAGTYTLAASLDNYDGNTLDITVQDGETAGGSIALTRQTGSAAVTVTFGDGASSVTPTFTLDGVTTITPTSTSGTGSSITYTFGNLTTGSHIIAAAATDYTAGGTSSVIVTKNTTTAGTGITFTRDTGSAAVTVTFGDGASSVTPTFTLDGATTITPTSTSGTGSSITYTFGNLTTGSHTIAAAATDYTAGGTSSVTVTKNTTTAGTGITFTRDTGSAAVTVTFSDGATTVTPTFTLDGATTITATSTSGAGGSITYTFGNLTTGSHTIAAAAADYTAGGTSSVTVTKNTTTAGTGITLTHDTGSAVITVNDGVLGLQGVTVSLNGTALSGTTDSSGVATIAAVPTGNYTAAATKTGYTSKSVGINVAKNGTATATMTIVPTYTITASAGANGSISSPGTTEIIKGNSMTYTFSPLLGYGISDVIVDGASIGSTPTSYTFSNVTANHTIQVHFVKKPDLTVTVSAGANGTVSPGTTTVPYGGSITFTASPAAGYMVSSLAVDGATQSRFVNSYTLSNITQDHTVTVQFIQGCTVSFDNHFGPTIRIQMYYQTTSLANKYLDLEAPSVFYVVPIGTTLSIYRTDNWTMVYYGVITGDFYWQRP